MAHACLLRHSPFSRIPRRRNPHLLLSCERRASMPQKKEDQRVGRSGHQGRRRRRSVTTEAKASGFSVISKQVIPLASQVPGFIKAHEYLVDGLIYPAAFIILLRLSLERLVLQGFKYFYPHREVPPRLVPALRKLLILFAVFGLDVLLVDTPAGSFLAMLLREKVVRKIVTSLGIAILGQMVSSLVQKIAAEQSMRAKSSEGINRVKGMGKFLDIAILASVLVNIVRTAGINLDGVMTLTGVGGLALGVFSRGIISNIVVGLFTSFQGNFGLGDEITVTGITGKITDVGCFRTTVVSLDRNVHIIPNTVFSDNVVVNKSRKYKNNELRFFKTITISMCVDLQETLNRIEKMSAALRVEIENHKAVYSDKEIRLFISNISPLGVEFYIAAYVKAEKTGTYLQIQNDILSAFMRQCQLNELKVGSQGLEDLLSAYEN